MPLTYSFYFGPQHKALYGVYHKPASEINRYHGVVLCNPIGQEYILAHRAFLQLAVRLTNNGFHILRFDYYGCGDSAGNYDEGDVDQWSQDICTAIDELKEQGDLKEISLIGLRFGATLAALAGSAQEHLKSIVLWDPIFKGKHYIDDLIVAHEKWVRDLSRKPPKEAFHHNQREIIGFPFSENMQRSIERVDLFEISGQPAGQILLVSSDDGILYQQFADHLSQMGSESTYQHIPATKVYLKEGFNKSLVPTQILTGIVSWLTTL